MRWAGSHPTSTRANGRNTTNNNQQPSKHPVHKTRPGQPLKPTTPLRPKNPPQTPISHPHRRWWLQSPHRCQQAKATTVSDKQATWPTGPGCDSHGQRRHHGQANFARNLSRSFFETPQKRCNSNDAHSMFEQAAGELRAKLMGSGGAWPDNESTRRAHISDPAPPVWRAPEGPEGTGCDTHGRWRGLVAVPVGGGRARAGLEIDHSEPSSSRVAISRAGRRPPALQATWPTGQAGITKPPGPSGAGRQWR